MGTIPKDPVILLSYINTQLRDFYPSLDEFCNAQSVEKSVVETSLGAIGYAYNPERNQFE